MNRRVAIKMIDLDQFERNQIDELRVCFKFCPLFLFTFPLERTTSDESL